jgi:tetratricopeptide (TPR) repeat protein
MTPGDNPNDGDAAVRRPTAIVSWAHGEDTWQDVVLEFATALRVVGGVDADLDLWHLTNHENWTTFGPTAIRESDFVLVAISSTYGRAWDGTNDPHKNAGAAVEAAAIKAIHEIDQVDFRRRVKVVLLPGAKLADIPNDLRGMAERFEVPAFDKNGMEKLLRSIYGKPLHQRPPLADLPWLPAHFIADVDTVRDSGPASAAPARVERATGEGRDERSTTDVLAEQLTAITNEIATIRAPEHGGAPDDGPSQAELERLRSTVQSAYDALQRVASRGVARQWMVSDYLYAQLYLSAGAHKAAEQRLASVRRRLPASDAAASELAHEPDLALEPCLVNLTRLATQLNDRMRDGRYRAVPRPRHPKPPAESVLETEHRERVRMFYEVARSAMNKPKPGGPVGVMRDAILHGRTPPDVHAARLYARYTERQQIATKALGLRDATPQGVESAGADWLVDSGLDLKEGALASVVLCVLAEAHLLVHLVEHHRSGPVGHILEPTSRHGEGDEEHLRRSIMLNTWVLAIGESMPWIFSSSEQERDQIQRDAEGARRKLRPLGPMWLARQVTLLSLYRRSHGFRLLNDHERAYNDLRIVQRIGRLTRAASKDDDAVTGWLDTLKALAEYRIGELYRADHDYMQALVQLCRSHDSVAALRDRSQSAIARELGHLELKLSLGKGKAFFEIGAMKRSLKWYLTAWSSMLDLQERRADAEPARQAIVDLEHQLEDIKHDLVFDKAEIQRILRPVVAEVCDSRIEKRYEALAADILIRVSHLLVVLRLPEDEPTGNGATGTRRDSSALRCMKRAAELDDRNLLVHTGLLRYEIRRPGSIGEPLAHKTLQCWPSGSSDVDQLIRAGEHMTLKRLWAAGQKREGEVGVARQLVDHFMTHTDSINLRGAILHRYLMRPRAEDREPWWEPESSARRTSAQETTGPSKQYLEFVCLRRFGSFTPFMPRPAAVSAVGGGYLVRVCRTTLVTVAGSKAKEAPRFKERLEVFNIVVDPGEGTVNNLYGTGLSIADIDMVIATHDHPDHLSALDSILSLRKERRNAQPAAAADAGDGGDRLLILGNRSVVNRYSFLNGDGKHLVQHIADANVLGGSAIPPNVKIVALDTQHEDLGGHNATAFVLKISPDGADVGDPPLSIAFMADTDVKGLHLDKKLDLKMEAGWDAALQSDVVVAHVSDVPSDELRTMAELPEDDPDGEIEDFVAKVARLAEQHPEDASQLMHALPLSPPHTAPWPAAISSNDAGEDGAQLYLSGLVEVCEHMRQAEPPSTGGARVLIVGELKEQLGSFRRTIAHEINERIFRDAPLVALTADIGLRIRVARPEPDTRDRNRVLCTTCSYNNDRLDLERFHPPGDIREVCVKGDHEAIYWNCDLHDPGKRDPPLFVEQMGGYNPFAAGGRYHG